MEARLSVLEAEMIRVRDRLHDFPPQLAAVIQDEFESMRLLIQQGRQQEIGENRRLTMRDFYISAGTIGVCLGLAKLLKLI